MDILEALRGLFSKVRNPYYDGVAEAYNNVQGPSAAGNFHDNAKLDASQVQLAPSPYADTQAMLEGLYRKVYG